jgi:pyruvate formate lyase activating enzyme
MDNEKRGVIFDIQRYSLHDGPGIRTLVFMKGCPLRCLWCSNPESQNFEKEVGHIQKNCVLCGACAGLCRYDAIIPGNFAIDRAKCVNCGACVRACNVNAKRLIGEDISLFKLVEAVEKDRLFYINSGGGVTVGGGEPLAQADFVAAILQACQDVRINTAMETCGFAQWEELNKTLAYIDILLYDLKHIDDEKHKRLTGVGNTLILDNARKAGNRVKSLFRIPLIPGLNDDDENLQQSFAFIRNIKMAVGVEILPYHNLGKGKYDWLSKQYALKNSEPYNENRKLALRERIAALKPGIDVKVL